MDHDIIVAGGGPAGVAFALALAGSGLRIAVVEKQPSAALAEPAYDGREIALTHASIDMLRRIGAWQRLPPGEIFPLRAAQVLNGGSKAAVDFAPAIGGHDALGRLVSNHHIRRALFVELASRNGVALLDRLEVTAADADADGAAVTLSGGRVLGARLLVAADSRFSKLRGMLGIDAEMNPVGRTMMVCRVALARGHDDVATEWFAHDQTMALLPLGPGQASAVLTVEQAEADRLHRLDDREFGRELTRRYRHRWGAMTVASPRHAYPLVTTWAERFAVPGAALIGDAAVGMHPVTAHGFNLGLAGADRLARRIGLALRRGRDWADAQVLRDYERGHRLACRPLYSGTNALVRLFTDERPLARAARMGVIHLGRRLPLVRGAVQRAVLHA